jgi:hypothetical protein
MKRIPCDLPQPLMALLDEQGFDPIFIVPSAIGVPAEPDVSPEEWAAENACLHEYGLKLLAEYETGISYPKQLAYASSVPS